LEDGAGEDAGPAASGDLIAIFGDYELLAELGRGGMGIVYRARHRSQGRVVALKMLLPARLASPSQLERFRLESAAVAELDHPNLLPVFEFGEYHGQPFFTMRVAEGGSLAARLAEGKSSLDAKEAAKLVATIARSVHYAHQRGVQHRDLKPANILLDAAGHPFVSDFGIAKFRDHDAGLTLTEDVLGSPAYLAPEQAAGDAKRVTNKADVYSLGAILFECLAGRPPFAGRGVAILLRQIAEEEPVAPRSLKPGLSRDLEIICLKCLRKDPDKRFGSAEELADELERWLRGEPILSRPVSAAEALARWCRRRPSTAAALAALAVAIVAGGAGVTLQWRRATELYHRQRLERYAADLQVASQALVGHDLGLARRMLAAQIPEPGEKDLRGFEWRLLDRLAAGQSTLALRGHSGTVTTVAFFPDGRRLVSGGFDRNVIVWDVSTGKALAKFVADRELVWSVAVSRQGDRIITAGGDGMVRFWTPEGQAAEEPLPGVRILRGAFPSQTGGICPVGRGRGVVNVPYMQSFRPFDAMPRAIEAGERFALALIAEAKGSSPQRTGAKALFFADGRVEGTLGGGCLEAEVRERALAALRSGRPERFELVLDHDFGWDDGLICGGKVAGLILPNAAEAADAWRALAARSEPVTWGARAEFSIELAGADDLGEWLYRETALPACALWIAGAGHIGRAVAPLAAGLDFEVTVFDDREALASRAFFPEASALRSGYWEDILREPPPARPLFGLIVTRGHQRDALALRHWIERPFEFLGMIGSGRKRRMIFERLVADGVAKREQLERVACPVGLEIGSSSVAEIAVSIAAQLIQKRSGLGVADFWRALARAPENTAEGAAAGGRG
jgi:xanthine/CO dehydrogenase XdhC/CoxF family maturation factor